MKDVVTDAGFVMINGDEDLTWGIPEDRMDEVIAYLYSIGERVEFIEDEGEGGDECV